MGRSQAHLTTCLEIGRWRHTEKWARKQDKTKQKTRFLASLAYMPGLLCRSGEKRKGQQQTAHFLKCADDVLGRGFPLAARNAINLLLLLTPAPVIFHLLLNNFKDMKVIKASPGRVRSHWLLWVEGCQFWGLRPSAHLHGPIGVQHNPGKYSNEAHGSGWK